MIDFFILLTATLRRMFLPAEIPPYAELSADPMHYTSRPAAWVEFTSGHLIYNDEVGK